jgi:alpha-galactosidase
MLSLPLLAAITIINSGNLILNIDQNMHYKIESDAEGAKEYYADYTAADVLYAEEAEIDTWTLRDVKETSCEDGKTYILYGNWQENGYDIEKILTVKVLDDFKDMVFVSSRYINHSDKILSVRAIESNRLKVASDQTIWSFQPTSSSRREDWILPVEEGFYQKNHLGMNNSDYGGGIPMVTLWRRDANLSTGLAEPELKLISMPVKKVRYEDYATMSLLQEFDTPAVMHKGDTLSTLRQFISVGKGDFFAPLRQFSRYMEAHEGYIPQSSEPEAFEAVWCAWGYERSFTKEEIIGTLPKVKELGFRWVDVDDGYQIAEGDWETNSRFDGTKDMREITDAIHSYGLKAKLWWAPLAADPDSKILKERPQMLLRDHHGAPEFITWWDSWYLSPVNPVTMEYTQGLVDRFIGEWGFDGLKLDGQHLNCCLPDYNPHSGLEYPEESVEKLPMFFQSIFDRAREIKPHAVIQICPCGCAMNFFLTPHMNQAVASDPTSSAQIRMKRKVYGAMCPDMAYYADHIELSDNADDFGTQIGIGGVIGSKFTWPKPNPDVKGDGYLLTPEKEAQLKKWVGIYNDKKLSTGEYLNLYDIRFDLPETHVIEKDGALYYAFYAQEWNGGKIELRGLDAEKTYTVTEYTSDDVASYTIKGSDPFITPTFKRDYLIEVKTAD